jgi:ferredoxin
MPSMFFPQYMKGREGTELAIGESILEHIRRIGRVGIDSECGGQGTCGMDIVRIEEGSEYLTKMTDAEMRGAILLGNGIFQGALYEYCIHLRKSEEKQQYGSPFETYTIHSRWAICETYGLPDRAVQILLEMPGTG